MSRATERTQDVADARCSRGTSANQRHCSAQDDQHHDDDDEPSSCALSTGSGLAGRAGSKRTPRRGTKTVEASSPSMPRRTCGAGEHASEVDCTTAGQHTYAIKLLLLLGVAVLQVKQLLVARMRAKADITNINISTNTNISTSE